MNLKKLSVVIVCILGLGGITSMVWAGFTFIHVVQENDHVTMVRHSNEDILSLKKRLWWVKGELSGEVDALQRQLLMEEILKIEQQILQINAKLGYKA